MLLKKIGKVFLILLCAVLTLLLAGIFLMYRADLPREDLEEKYFSNDSHYVTATINDLDGNPVSIDLHYRDSGETSDPVIVLLHGAFSSLHTFEGWKEDLVASQYRVISIDLPNHGLSGNFSDNTISLRRSAAAVKFILDSLDVKDCTIGGNSMGGSVAWQFASEYHGKDGFEVQGLVLIDAVYPEMPSGEFPEIMNLLSNPILKPLISKMTPRFLLKSILEGVYGSASSLDSATLDRYYDLLRKAGNREALISAVQEVPATDDLDGAGRLEAIREAGIPILVLWGEEDSWISKDYAAEFKSALALEDHDVILYSGLGHVPMEENPELTVLDLLAFLDFHRR